MTDYRAELQRLVKAYDDHGGRWPDDDVQALYQAVQKARAALSAPEQGPTDEELLRCYGMAKRDHQYDGPFDDWPRKAERAATIHGLRAVLARWGRPAVEPVPVSERLPGPEDTTDRNECWYWHPGEECWEMVPVVTCTLDEWTHWLPYWALPVPQEGADG